MMFNAEVDGEPVTDDGQSDQTEAGENQDRWVIILGLRSSSGGYKVLSLAEWRLRGSPKQVDAPEKQADVH